MFISRVPHTAQNSTQYLANFKPSPKAELGPRNYNSYGNNDIEFLEQENVDFLLTKLFTKYNKIANFTL